MKLLLWLLIIPALLFVACSPSGSEDGETTSSVEGATPVERATSSASDNLDGVYEMGLWDSFSDQFKADAIANNLGPDDFPGKMILTIDGNTFFVVMEGDEDDPGDTGTIERDGNRLRFIQQDFVSVMEFDPVAQTITQVPSEEDEGFDQSELSTVVFTKRS